MAVSSVINLILSIFGISVSSIFILFWCTRFLCAHFLSHRTAPRAAAFLRTHTPFNGRIVEQTIAGVNPLVVAAFPIISYSQNTFVSGQDVSCAICLGEYKEGDYLRFLPQCGHIFHVDCIDAWLQQHSTCPVCRMSLQGYFVGRDMLLPRVALSDSTTGQTSSEPQTTNSDITVSTSTSEEENGVCPNLQASFVAEGSDRHVVQLNSEEEISEDLGSASQAYTLDTHAVDMDQGYQESPAL